MTNNQVKQYLMRYRHIQKSIQIKKDKIKQLQAQAADITSTISPDVVQSGNTQGCSFADTITLAMDIEAQMHAEMCVQQKILAEIDLRLNNMSKDYPQLANVLYLYYLNGLTWEQVCVELELSWMHVVGRLQKPLWTLGPDGCLTEELFRITTDGLQRKQCPYGWANDDINNLTQLLTGKQIIDRVPFRPKQGETYYYVRGR